MTKDEAEERLRQYQRRGRLPGPAMARQIAIATGFWQKASNRRKYPPMTKAQEQAEVKAHQDRIHLAYSIGEAIKEILEADKVLFPENYPELFEEHYYRGRDLLPERARAAAKWLLEMARAADEGIPTMHDDHEIPPPKHLM